MNASEIQAWSQLNTSSQLLWVSDAILVMCAVAGLVAAIYHFRTKLSDGQAGGLVHRAPIFFMYCAGGALSLWTYHRWIEVNHFPSQTMNEVLTMFTLALVLSMIVLHHALGLQRRGPGWAVLDDVLMIIIAGSALYTHVHVRGLVTAQRDLPPALQSYWFPPHLAALIFSYATLFIAGVMCCVYFCTRFWTGVFRGGYSFKSQVLVLLGLTIIPFAHLFTLPILLITSLVFMGLAVAKKLPEVEAMRRLEKELDDVSFRAFAVGMPFLTAGLWMGAFWAQEAWANYWGWDSKENTALISWLIYVVYIHLRLLGGYRGEKAMAVLMGGALSIFITFQIFGYLPDSQKSLHRYTDDGVVPSEGLSLDDQQASAPPQPVAEPKNENENEPEKK
ncbi:MAG: cytochrome c biogenesis protein CcsA [bacterium]|nr:cytochrome c biogenesis protein CcsA [bacterium]